MRQLIGTAYEIKQDRIEGPGWPVARSPGMDFDIEAKMPNGARAFQIPLMLQSLLEDRFKLSAHRGTKVTDFYALLVGKEGAKLTELNTETDDFSRFNWGISGNVFQSVGTKTTAGPNGLTTVEMSTLSEVANLLDPHFGGLPVVDKTGLQGIYSIKLQYTLPDAGKARADGQTTAEYAADVRDQMCAGVISGIENLGLRIEKQRGEIEILVIDYMEKVPTQN